ncbi:hypothetical protein QZH41_004166 [Actinostola sp. cb2023]|nr:hypothetical protein QZH41_004166 [Actinostola sp. cb2023]
MEILRSNFLESLPLISEAIDSAAFVALDAEFSGLNTKWRIENAIDTPQERYTKILNTSKDFLIIQFGLCTFSLDAHKNCYVAKPFNFYIFPKHLTRDSPDVRFLCQSSSIDFLIGHNFDFNKWIHEGISYLRPYDEDKLRMHFQERHEQSFGPFTSPGDGSLVSPAGSTTSATKSVSLKTPVIIPPEHQPFVDKACNEIEEMLKDPEGKSTSLPPCNGYLRKLIYQSAKQRFTSGIQLEKSTNEKKECYIVVTKVDEDDKKKFEQKKQTKEKEVLETAVGFSTVIKMISQSGKLIAGHNMLLDLLHMVHQFHCPLPDEVEEFKATIQALYPRIVDTKVMATTQPFRDQLPSTILGDLVKHLSVPPFKKPTVQLDPEFSRYKEGSENLHEAAYDAYITGLSFLSMANYLGCFQDPPKPRVSPDSTLVSPFVNKIFLMRMEDIPYLNLAGEDLKPSRDHVFFLTFPSTWKYSDILDLFSPFGFVYVSWVNSESAFISLAIRGNKNKVLEALDIEDAAHTIMSYAEYFGYPSHETQPNNLREHETGSKRPRSQEMSAPENKSTNHADVKVDFSEPEDGEILEDTEEPDIHDHLTTTYGLPIWASFAIFGVVTVMAGLLLGVVTVYATDYFFDRRQPQIIQADPQKKSDDAEDSKDTPEETAEAEEEKTETEETPVRKRSL